MNKLTDFFKLLSDETRLRILVLLFHKEYCVCEIYGSFLQSFTKSCSIKMIPVAVPPLYAIMYGY